MGFFGLLDNAPLPRTTPTKLPRGVSVDMLHRMECKACPLNHAKCRSPKIEPLGDRRARIYVLGTAPNEQADDHDRPWGGAELAFLKRYLPRDAFEAVRWNNVVRTHPGMDPKPVELRNQDAENLFNVRSPNFVEIECCRPSVVRDIEDTQPEAIFTFGPVPLRWVADETHANLWQGRRIPVKVGSHVCWLYPFQHPYDLIKERRWEGFKGDNEFAFELYLKRACYEVLDGAPQPVIHSEVRVRSNIVCRWGEGGDADLDEIEDFLLRKCPKDPDTANGFDIETNKLRPYNSDAKLLSFAVSTEGLTYAVAVEHKEALWSKTQRKRLLDILYRWMMLKGFTKAVHQLAFELEWMAVFLGKEIVWGSRWDDTIGQAFVLNETQGLLALENLTMQHFGFNIKNLSNLDRRNLEAAPLKDLLPYNGMDAKYHRELLLVQDPLLDDAGLRDFYEHFTLRPRALVLTQLEGIPVEQSRVQEYRDEFEPVIDKANAELAKLKEVKAFNRGKLPEDHFSPSNTNHLAALLRAAGIKLARTEKGGDATDVKNIKGVNHPAIKPTLSHRKASKVLSTYMDSVTEGHEKSAIYDDGLVHCIISATKVTTSRTSSEAPNIQNWPKRNENAKVRRVVKARPGYKLVSVDYGSIQARNVAMESRDRKLVQSFIDDYDIHSDWLEKMDKIFPAWTPKGTWTDAAVKKAARNAIKNQFVFPTFFGARPSPKMCRGIFGVAGEVMPEPKHVAEMQEMFFDEFPEIADWHARLRKDYYELGYVTGLSGHRRHAPVDYTQLINAPIQADETIIVLSSHIALTRLDPELYTPCMEIHDDLTFHLPERGLDERIDVILREMTKVRFDWIDPIPLEVELAVGDDWDGLKDRGKFKNRPDGKPGYIEIGGH